MLLVTLSAEAAAAATAATLALAPAPEQAADPLPEIAAEYLGSQSRNAQSQVWTRHDIRFTNREATRQTIRVCPDDGFRRYFEGRGMFEARGMARKQLIRMHSHALAVDGSNFHYRCIERDLEPGASATIGFYFGHGKPLDFIGPIVLAMDFGTFEVVDGRIAAIAGRRSDRGSDTSAQTGA